MLRLVMQRNYQPNREQMTSDEPVGPIDKAVGSEWDKSREADINQIYESLTKHIEHFEVTYLKMIFDRCEDKDLSLFVGYDECL